MRPNTFNSGKGIDWTFQTDSSGRFSNDQVTNALLQDIRNELRQLNRVFDCTRFLDVPDKLDQLVTNTTKPKRKRKKVTA